MHRRGHKKVDYNKDVAEDWQQFVGPARAEIQKKE